jgi:hypothetical protein
LSYDFKAARDRREERKELVLLYSQGRKLNPDDQDWGWDLIAQIDEIDRELAEAHQNAKMATARNSNHPVNQFDNVVIPIVPHWRESAQSQVEEQL